MYYLNYSNLADLRVAALRQIGKLDYISINNMDNILMAYAKVL